MQNTVSSTYADTLLTRDITRNLRGISAIGILIFHVLLRFTSSPLVTPWGSFFVAIFLILSGYGINESYKHKGTTNYWKNRWSKVILPTAIFIAIYNFFSPDCTYENFINELLSIKPSYWFVFHIIKCYVAYWIAIKYCYRWRWFVWIALALVCLNVNGTSYHLEAEQSLSFIAGVFLSEKNDKLKTISCRKTVNLAVCLLAIAAVFFCVKAIPVCHELKGTIAYNYFLLPMKFCGGMGIGIFLALIFNKRNVIIGWCGEYSLEFYICHVCLMEYIISPESLIPFFLLSSLAFGFLYLQHRFLCSNYCSTTLLIYLTVNVLFVSKYGERVSTAYYQIAVTIYVLAALVAYYIIQRWQLCKRHFRTLTILCVILFSGMVAVQYYVDPMQVQVDRWSALHYPIQYLLDGRYPYMAQTHLGGYGSPFPVWQLFHIPFYLMGNVGLSLFFTVALFVYAVYHVYGKNIALFSALLILASPAVWYEATVRSDLIANILVLSSFIIVILPRLNVQWMRNNVIWLATAIALLACTRLLVLLPLFVMFFSTYLKIGWKHQIYMIVAFVFIYTLTFLPLALWDTHDFFYFQHNPWSLQTRQGNPMDFILYIPIALLLTMWNKEGQSACYRNMAVLLFLFIGINFIHRGLDGQYLFSNDITYLSTALPFCIMSLSIKAEPTI